ncbi:MAG TPA: hypothetical protein VK184_23315 [Nostocaceae cyanobacterium]|nr:hypothetical protein [Nostocaceae cyanobacterium]
MPCLFPLLYQKAVLKGRGFKPNFLVKSAIEPGLECGKDSLPKLSIVL